MQNIGFHCIRGLEIERTSGISAHPELLSRDYKAFCNSFPGFPKELSLSTSQSMCIGNPSFHQCTCDLVQPMRGRLWWLVQGCAHDIRLANETQPWDILWSPSPWGGSVEGWMSAPAGDIFAITWKSVRQRMSDIEESGTKKLRKRGSWSHCRASVFSPAGDQIPWTF